MKRSGRAIVAAAVAVVVAGAVAAVGLSSPVGLRATARAASGPALTGTDTEPGTLAVDEWSSRLATMDLAIEWSGLISVPPPGRALSVVSAGAFDLAVDGRVVLRREAAGAVAESRTTEALAPGLHLIALSYRRDGAPSNLALRWTTGGGWPQIVPATALAPESPWTWRAREYRTPAVVLLQIVWLAGLVGLAAWCVVRYASDGVALDRSERAALGGVAVLLLVGIWWGWPGPGWSPDELDPGTVLGALGQRFSDGWHDKYPPVFFYVLSASYAPVLAGEALGWLDTRAPDVVATLYLCGRLVSLAFAVGTVYVVMVLARRLVGRRHATLSGVMYGVALPTVFYAKTANLESAYLFWFAISLLFISRAVETSGRRDAVAAGIAGALAVATKDSAYALYVLPLAWLIWTDRHRARWWLGLLAGGLTLVICFNVLANWSGVVQHVQVIAGPASASYRMFESDLRGHLRLLWTTAAELIRVMSPVGLALACLGAVVLWWRQASLPAWFVLTNASYYLGFIAVIGYVYDRFLMPLLPVLAMLAAVGLRAIYDRSSRGGRWLAWGIVAWLFARAVSFDFLLVNDSRYAVEAWFRTHARPEDTVAFHGSVVYLPRLARYGARRMEPDISETELRRPDLVVVNAENIRRDFGDASRLAWWEWLSGGAGAYVEVFRYKATPALGRALLDARFWDRSETPLSNLDKVNPEIVVFRRR